MNHKKQYHDICKYCRSQGVRKCHLISQALHHYPLHVQGKGNCKAPVLEWLLKQTQKLGIGRRLRLEYT